MKTPTLHAYTWRSGFIYFGPRIPKGALLIASGNPKKLRSLIGVLARHAYPKRRGGPSRGLLVPGVPEAPKDGNQAVDALIEFSKRVKGRLNS